MWNTHCFWVDAHPRQVVVGLQQTVRHGKKLFGVSHYLEKRCVGALLGVWNSTFRFVCGVLFLAPCGVAGYECGW